MARGVGPRRQVSSMMSAVPTFFLSHTRQDREIGNYLSRFVKNLEETVAQYAAVDLKTQKLATIDSDIDQGEDWDNKLSRKLSTNKVFVAVFTPLYFKRPNCGKELGVFLLRSLSLDIDSQGALTDVVNIMPIRWLPEHVYAKNTVKDARIPAFLRRIEDTPRDPGDDKKRTNAIRRYKKKGMASCVGGVGYKELIDTLASRIRDMPDLKPGPITGFADAIDAFACDWASYLKKPPIPPSPPPLVMPPLQPQPLTSIVAFFATNQNYTPDPVPVDFAEQLISETAGANPPDPALQTLLGDVYAAGAEEGLTVFHAAALPPAFDGLSLLTRLKALAKRGVLSALLVDPDVWPGSSTPAASAVEEVIRSTEWTGPTLLTAPLGGEQSVADVLRAKGLPAGLCTLPSTSDLRQVALRQAFVDARGRLLRSSTDQATNSEPLPLLKSVRPTRK